MHRHDQRHSDRPTCIGHPADLGLPSIWQLNVSAAEAYRKGFPKAAAAILEVADAAEQELLRCAPQAFPKLKKPIE